MIKTLYIFLLLIGSVSLSQAQKWELAKEADNIKIETRFIKGWDIKEYKITMLVKCSLTEAANSYWNPIQRKKFMERSLEVSNLKQISTNQIITYNLVDAPWPVADRDNITRSTRSYPQPNTILVSLISLPSYIPAKSGIVRVPRTKGYWKYIDMGNGLVKIVHQYVADSGGSIPDWLVNSTILEGPFGTFKALQRLLEKPKKS